MSSNPNHNHNNNNNNNNNNNHVNRPFSGPRIDSDADAARLAKQLGVEDPHWRNNIRQFMRLSNFSYGIVGATLFTALVLWRFKAKVDDSASKPSPPK